MTNSVWKKFSDEMPKIARDGFSDKPFYFILKSNKPYLAYIFIDELRIASSEDFNKLSPDEMCIFSEEYENYHWAYALEDGRCPPLTEENPKWNLFSEKRPDNIGYGIWVITNYLPLIKFYFQDKNKLQCEDCKTISWRSSGDSAWTPGIYENPPEYPLWLWDREMEDLEDINVATERLKKPNKFYTLSECQIRSALEDFFGDQDKVNIWLETPNPLLGGLPPQTMIDMGKEAKLLKMIKATIGENFR